MLVGREVELAELLRLIEGKRPAAVFGEAGVGKTALVREAARRGGVALAEAGALATLSWHPYLPFRRLLGREPTGDSAYVAAEVERTVGDGLLFLDDAHWADAETRAAILFLAGRIRLVAAVRRGDPNAGAMLEELGAAGFSLVPVEPLDRDHALELIGSLRPEISRATAGRLVERTGGNPLLIEELAASGEPTQSLGFVLAARLRSLPEAAREAMGMLALARRPLAAAALGTSGEDLVEAGLADRVNGDLAVRHTLLAEVAASELEETERKRLHLLVAELLEEPGEAARHLAAGGERERAFAEAMRAVSRSATSGERALHLELAATCAGPAEAEGIRLEAAAALSAAGLNEQAARLLEDLVSDDPSVPAFRHLYRSRAAVARSDLELARAECEQGLALVAGDGTEIEALLALHDAQTAQVRALVFDIDAGVAHDKATRALALARGSKSREAQALALVASIGVATQAPGWQEEYASSLERARRVEEADLEFRIASGFRFALLVSGELEEALAVTRESVARAQERKLTVWDRRLRLALAGVLWHAGELAAALEGTEELAAEAAEPDQRPEFYRSQVLSDLGRHEEALAIARALAEEALPTWTSLGEALWARADAELAAGRPGAALRVSDELLERFGNRGPTAFAHVTRGWALHDLGRELDLVTIDADQPLVAGAPPELRALAHLVEGRSAEAAEGFAAAAALWEDRHFRGHLRCLWASGEALRRTGDAAGAIDVLERAETVAQAHGEAPTLRRIRRSLRLAGVRRAARRARAGELTAREREVLELVADGISNAEIARRLGVGRPTVERTLQSASRKLGAKTRAQAAALVVGR